MTDETSETIMAWHFLRRTDEHPQGALRDSRPAPADGEWLVHDGAIEIDQSGLHASAELKDALLYAPGSILCRVECAQIAAQQNRQRIRQRPGQRRRQRG